MCSAADSTCSSGETPVDSTGNSSPVNVADEINVAVENIPATDPEHLRVWLRLAMTPGIGPISGQHLLRELGLPESVFEASFTQLRALLKTDRMVHALLDDDPVRDAAITRALNWQAARPGRHLLPLDDPRYPSALLELPDPPLVLYAEGNLGALVPGMVAIVGSRRATQDGLHNAASFARALAERGLTVISGLAEGIDSAAHRGALAGASPEHPATLAVTGTGLDRIYPAHHRPLAAQILARHGLILSEQPLGSAPTPGNFPRRNRLIAALAKGVLVAEAALKSGSLITARLAAELGREVMAIPGSIHNPLAHGCHYLIRDGATLVETVDDILEALGKPCATPHPETVGSNRNAARTRTRRAIRPRDEWKATMQGTPRQQALVTVSPPTLTGQVPAAASISSTHPAGASGDDTRPSTSPARAAASNPARPAECPRNNPATTNTADTARAPAQPNDHGALLSALASHPHSAEALAARLGWPIDRVLVALQLLEIQGHISRHMDGRWQTDYQS